MLTKRLLSTACTLAMLAAVPAFAQSSTTPGGDAGTPAPTTPDSATSSSSTMGSQGSTDSRPMRKSAMGSHHAMRSGRSDMSQNAAVDRLNEQSYQAAQQGQSFTGSSSMPASSMPAGGMSTGGMSNGMTPASGSTGGKKM